MMSRARATAIFDSRDCMSHAHLHVAANLLGRRIVLADKRGGAAGLQVFAPGWACECEVVVCPNHPGACQCRAAGCPGGLDPCEQGTRVLIGVADPLKNLGLIHVLDDDAAHRADDGVQRGVDIGSERLTGKVGEELVEERSKLCGVEPLVLKPIVGPGEAEVTPPELGVDPSTLSAKTSS